MPTDVEDRRIAIVPGARVFEDGRPAAVLEDRLLGALKLYRAGEVDAILVSGDHAAREYDEVKGMSQWLKVRGVPAEHLLEDPAGFRTLDTMMRAASVFGVRDAVICTNAFHLWRSVYLARAAGITAVGIACDRQVYATRRKNRLREAVARARAVLDLRVFRTKPRFAGPLDY